MSKEELKEIAFFLQEHIIFNSFNQKYKNDELNHFVRLIKKEFPNYMYNGIVYRAIFLNKKENFNPEIEIGTSFSASKEGLLNFVNMKVRDEKKQPKYIAVIEGNVNGIDIFLLTQDLLKKDLIEHNQYFNEDEILLSEKSDFVVRFFTYKQFVKSF